MDVFEAMYQRQSVSKVKPEAVPRELIEQLLNAAVQAPNHHKVRPWRFAVLQGAAREKLGEAMARSLQIRKIEATADDLQKERLKPLRAPVVIAVAVDKPAIPKVLEIENVAAVAAAVQNLLLAAHALGLGAFWRTGPAASDPAIKSFLGFAPDQNVIGFVYVGYPEMLPSPPQRPSFEDRTLWLD
ncbi:MAG: nitroreductase [Chloroflexi bacterium]|nr:nitroreductase [Chloroflexota bacterium]